jgi:hypothetical protein
VNYNINLFVDDNTSEKQSFCSPTTIHAHLVGTESHKLQLMKANFFELIQNDLIQGKLFGNIKTYFYIFKKYNLI